MKKQLKIFLSLLSFSSLVSISIITSCSQPIQKDNNLVNNELKASYAAGSIFDLNNYKSSFTLLDLSNVKKQNISEFQTVHEINTNTTFLGKFNEPRQFYNSLSTSYHAGIDIFMKEKTPVYSPYKSSVHKVLLSYTDSEDKQNALGGIVILKINLKDINNISSENKNKIIEGIETRLKKQELKEEEKFIYCMIYHLDNSVIHDIMKQNKYKNEYWTENKKYGAANYNEPSIGQKDVYEDFLIQPNTIIGKVGESIMNGGWSPHIHLQYVYPHYLPDRKVWAPGVVSNQEWIIKNYIDPMIFYDYSINSSEYKLI